MIGIPPRDKCKIPECPGLLFYQFRGYSGIIATIKIHIYDEVFLYSKLPIQGYPWAVDWCGCTQCSIMINRGLYGYRACSIENSLY